MTAKNVLTREQLSWWTPARVEELRRLWRRGLSSPEIARRLETTPDAVIGKANRIGCNKRPRAAPPRRAAPKFAMPVPCEWIEGDPKEARADPDAAHCGRLSVPGVRYCPEHWARVNVRRA